MVGIGTALADDPQLTAAHRGRARASRAGSSSTPRPACRWTPSSSRGAAEVPLTVVVTRAAPRTAVDALEVAGAEVIVATGANEPDRVRNALVQLGAQGITAILLEGGPHLAGAFLDAGEVDEIRLFVAPVVLGGSTARDPLEGEGVERIAEAAAGAHARLPARRRRRPDLRPHAGVVSVFTGLVADMGTVTAVDATADGVRLAVSTALAGELRGRLGGGQRRLPDRHRDRRRRASAPT